MWVGVFVKVGVRYEGVAVSVEEGLVSFECRGGLLYADDVWRGLHEKVEEIGEGVRGCGCGRVVAS